MLEKEDNNPEGSIVPDQAKPLSISGSLKKYSGLQMFQEYCIPNSTATKNPLFLHIKAIGKLPFYSLESTDNTSLEERLKKRLLGCYLLGGWHLTMMLYSSYLIIEDKKILVKALNIFYLIINTYLVANQAEVRSRIKRVMQQRGIV